MDDLVERVRREASDVLADEVSEALGEWIDLTTRLRGFVQEFADEPCIYNDGCPLFVKTNHGECWHCRARRILYPRPHPQNGLPTTVSC